VLKKETKNLMKEKKVKLSQIPHHHHQRSTIQSPRNAPLKAASRQKTYRASPKLPGAQKRIP